MACHTDRIADAKGGGYLCNSRAELIEIERLLFPKMSFCERVPRTCFKILFKF